MSKFNLLIFIKEEIQFEKAFFTKNINCMYSLDSKDVDLFKSVIGMFLLSISTTRN